MPAMRSSNWYTEALRLEMGIAPESEPVPVVEDDDDDHGDYEPKQEAS